MFNWLKNLTRDFVHRKPFNILALFTWNCRTIVFPCKGSHNSTLKSMFAISSLFAADQPHVHATTPLLNKNLAGHGVHTLTFKCLTVVVKKFDFDF